MRIFSKKFAIIIIGLFVISGITSVTFISEGKRFTDEPIEIEPFEWFQTIEIAIVFVNFDMSMIDTNFLEYYLPYYFWVYEEFQYQVEISIYDASDEYEDKLNKFVNKIADTDATTSDVDFLALEEQAIDGHVRDIFFERSGTAISAEKMEKWFHKNPYEKEADYRYYALNFSHFDTLDHEKEHWFSVEEIDPDTGVQRHWWRNEWDFPVNFDAKFPFAGYSQEYADYFFDPFMFQWFTKWNKEWFGLGQYRQYYDWDLDEYIKIGGDATYYMYEWLLDIILMHNYVYTPSYGNSVSIQLTVFQNVSHLGYTNEDLKWIVNEDYVKEQFKDLIPNADVNVEIVFENWIDHPELESFFQGSEWDTDIYYGSDPPIPDYKYYNGYQMWDYLWQESFSNQFFNDDAAEVIAKGYAFIVDNATFSYPGLWSGGGLFTGLGGGSQMIQLMELDRLYYPDRITPRQGFSQVVIHEAGHAVGLPHTFGGAYVASDFIGDVMGYYPGSTKFSKVRTDHFQRHAANLKAIYEINPLLEPFILEPERYRNRDLQLINWFQKLYLYLRDKHFYAEGYSLLEILEEYLHVIKPIDENLGNEKGFHSYYKVYLVKMVKFLRYINRST